MKGSGVDITLHSFNFTKGLKWNTTLIASYSSNEVTEYYNTAARGLDYVSNGNEVTSLVGRPVYSIVSFQWRGLDASGNPIGSVKGSSTTTYTDITGTKTGIEDSSATLHISQNLSHIYSIF